MGENAGDTVESNSWSSAVKDVDGAWLCGDAYIVFAPLIENVGLSTTVSADDTTRAVTAVPSNVTSLASSLLKLVPDKNKTLPPSVGPVNGSTLVKVDRTKYSNCV